MKVDFDSAVKSLQDLIKINSVQTAPAPNAPFGEGNVKALEYSLRLLESFGFKTVNGNNYYGYGDIGNPDLPLFGILAHLDVVPVSTTWEHYPFGGEIEDGYLYGRGALDDKGPFIASLYACAELLNEGYIPKKRIRFILGCNEESGWKCMDEYTKNEEMPKEGFSPDADFPVINCEKGVVYHHVKIPVGNAVLNVKCGERANVVPDFATATIIKNDEAVARANKVGGEIIDNNDGTITINTNGVSAHGSTPNKGDNALTKLLYSIAPIDEAIKVAYNAFISNDGKGLNLNIEDEKSGKLTLNLGVAKLEDGILELIIDIRYPISITMDDITEIFKNYFIKVNGTVTRGAYHLPLFVEKEDPLIISLLGAYNEVTGEQGEAITIGGGTYARVLPKGVAFGPVFPNGESRIHGDDERINLQDMQKTIKIYKEAIKRLCF